MHVFTEWIWWFDSRSPQSIVWMAGSFQSTQDVCFPFSSAHPLCLVVFSTLPLRHPGNAEEDVCSVFLRVATSVADCELDVQFLVYISFCLLIVNSIVVEEAVDNHGLHRNDWCNVCFHVLANDARTMTLKHWRAMIESKQPTLTYNDYIASMFQTFVLMVLCNSPPWTNLGGGMHMNDCSLEFLRNVFPSNLGFGKLLLENAVP